jgi:hypothetical protein
MDSDPPSIASESGFGFRILMNKNWKKLSWKNRKMFCPVFDKKKITIYLPLGLHKGHAS